MPFLHISGIMAEAGRYTLCIHHYAPSMKGFQDLDGVFRFFPTEETLDQ